MKASAYASRLNKLKKDPRYDPEMDKATDLYLEHLMEQAMTYSSPPTVAAEVVPEDWQSWTLDRRRICALEVWCEALDGKQKDMRYSDIAEINGIIEACPGWQKGMAAGWDGKTGGGCPGTFWDRRRERFFEGGF